MIGIREKMPKKGWGVVSHAPAKFKVFFGIFSRFSHFLESKWLKFTFRTAMCPWWWWGRCGWRRWGCCCCRLIFERCILIWWRWMCTCHAQFKIRIEYFDRCVVSQRNWGWNAKRKKNWVENGEMKRNEVAINSNHHRMKIEYLEYKSEIGRRLLFDFESHDRNSNLRRKKMICTWFENFNSNQIVCRQAQWVRFFLPNAKMRKWFLIDTLSAATLTLKIAFLLLLHEFVCFDALCKTHGHCSELNS